MTSIAPPFSACMQIRPPNVSRLGDMALKDGGVVDHEDAGIGHEKLEAGDAFADRGRPFLRAARSPRSVMMQWKA